MIVKILGALDVLIALALIASIHLNIPTNFLFAMGVYLLIKGGFSLVG